MEIEYKILDSIEISKIPIDLLLEADPSHNSIASYIKRSIGIGAYESELAGCCLIIETRPRTYEIINVVVRDIHQGKGIGKNLVQIAIKEIIKLGAHTIEIGTGNSSINQLALYQKCGFRITSVDKNYFIKNYSEDLYEDGIQCRDMIRLRIDL